MNQNREELLKHLAASLKDAKEDGGAILLVGAGISVSAGIPPAQKLMKIAIKNFPNYFTKDEQKLAQEDLSQLQYNDIMTKLSNVKRKELFKWFIEGNEEKGIEKAKLNFAHIAIAELLKQRYFSRILTVNFDPLLIHACYMVGMYPLPAIYDLGAMGQVNAELLHDPSIVYLNGQHVGFVQRNTTDQLKAHTETLTQIVRSTGCNKTWVVAGYSGENDPLMDALNELRPYNNWLYWLEYNNQVLQKDSHHFLENDEESKVVYECDADQTFIEIAEILECNLDFIEHPQKKLETYLAEIHFQTAHSKAENYQDKIHSFISVLNNEINNKNFEIIAQLESIYNDVKNEIFKQFFNEKIQENTWTNIDNKVNKALKLDESDKTLHSYIMMYLDINKTVKKSLIKQSLLDKAENYLNKSKVQNDSYFYLKSRIYTLRNNYPEAMASLKKIKDLKKFKLKIKLEPDLQMLREHQFFFAWLSSSDFNNI